MFGYNAHFDRNVRISIATAHKLFPDKFKYSVHCVVNVGCTKQTNKFAAIILNKILDVNLQVKDMVDLGIYARNSSLRLPHTIKIGVTGPENRML